MKLKPYQNRIVDFLKDGKNSILSVGMGLGKTAATLHFINETKPGTLLIVAPKRVAETVWMQEAEKWGLCDMAQRMVIVAGSKAKRLKAIADESKPYKIISRDNLTDIEGMSFDCVVLDELTSFKNHESKRSKIIQSIKSNQKIGLTGTFLANGSIDIFGQCAALGIYDNSKKGNFYQWRANFFKDKFAGSGLQFQKWVPTVPLDDILQFIRPNIFTLDSKDWMDIPAVEYVTHGVQLTTEEKERYDNLEAFLHFDLNGEEISLDAEQKFGKLQTLCNGFIYQDVEGVRLPTRGQYSTKLEEVADFCERCEMEGERVLLFYAFVEEAIWLGEMLKDRGLKFCSPKDKRFLQKWESGEIDVLMAHPASLSYGMNLQSGGRICVWSSITYNLDYWLQANARLARTGQQKGVQIHIFLTNETIEQNQYKTLMNKDKILNEFINLTK